MKKLDHKFTYARHLKALKKKNDHQAAMELAVGGSFAEMGQMEVDLLRHYGLQPSHHIVDVGCGSGRLAHPLSQTHQGPYLGTDIMPELISYAKKIVPREDWRFEVSEGLDIPEKDGVADFACFFSVFTHLLHEESFVYLKETRRILKPGGKVVFSFLDFTQEGHWHIFEGNIAEIRKDTPLNMFLSREAVEAWAKHLDFTLEDIRDGSEAFIPMEGGGLGSFGQSVAVLVRN